MVIYTKHYDLPFGINGKGWTKTLHPSIPLSIGYDSVGSPSTDTFINFLLMNNNNFKIKK